MASDTLDSVQLNYVNLENRRIKPITIKIPDDVLLEYRMQELGRRALRVINLGRLRKDFNARTRRR